MFLGEVLHNYRHPPVFGGVSDPGDQLHGLGVVMRLNVQTQEILHKVFGGHVMLPLFHHAGILQGRKTCSCSIDNKARSTDAL